MSQLRSNLDFFLSSSRMSTHRPINRSTFCYTAHFYAELSIFSGQQVFGGRGAYTQCTKNVHIFISLWFLQTATDFSRIWHMVYWDNLQRNIYWISHLTCVGYCRYTVLKKINLWFSDHFEEFVLSQKLLIRFKTWRWHDDTWPIHKKVLSSRWLTEKQKQLGWDDVIRQTVLNSRRPERSGYSNVVTATSKWRHLANE